MPYNEIDKWAKAYFQVNMAHEIAAGDRFDDPVIRRTVDFGFPPLGRELSCYLPVQFIVRLIVKV